MKILRKLVLAAVPSIMLFGACEKAFEDKIATEVFTVDKLTIKTTADLPLLIGRDSLLPLEIVPVRPTRGELLWTSSNPAVATVDTNGRVKALSVGNADIIVNSTDGSMPNSTIKVRVIDRIDFATGISFSHSSLSVFEGEKGTVVATILPANATYKTMVWSSRNPSIATVSPNGLITGIAKGNTVITVSVTDGSNVSNTFNVEVKEVVPISAIQINTDFTESLAIGEKVAIDFSVTPTTASKQFVRWSSSSEAVASVDANGVVTALGDGESTLTATSTDGNEVVARKVVKVELGKINDTFTGSVNNWIASTPSSVGVIQNGVFKITMNGSANQRGDFRRSSGATVHAGKFPIIAFKFKRPALTAGNVIFDTNLGRYQQHLANGNNQMTIATAKDGVQVFYANIAAGSFSTTQTKLSTTAATTLTTFQVVVADFPTAQLISGNTYDVYWIKTFKSEAELLAYINQ